MAAVSLDLDLSPKQARETAADVLGNDRKTLKSLLWKTVGLPDKVTLMETSEVSRESILQVNRAILQERHLSDEARKAPLLAVYIDERLKLEVNDNSTGHLATGTTGCGKTECIGNGLLHQAYRHQPGIIRESWWTSETFLCMYRDQLISAEHIARCMARQKAITNEKAKLEKETYEMRDRYNAAQNLLKGQKGFLEDYTSGSKAADAQQLAKSRREAEATLLPKLCAGSSRPVLLRDEAFANFEEWVSSIPVDRAVPRGRQRPFLRDFAAISDPPPKDDAENAPGGIESTGESRDEMETAIRRRIASCETTIAALAPAYSEFKTKWKALNDEMDDAAYEIVKLIRALQTYCTRDNLAMKYERMPFGGMAIDQKGSYWGVLSSIAVNYNKLPMLALLQARPSWAKKPEDRHRWRPLVRWNLLSLPPDLIPSRTYAEMIVDTAASFKGANKGGGGKDYFVNASRDYISHTIELERQIHLFKEEKRRIQCKADGTPFEPKPMLPSLVQIGRMLTDGEGKIYRTYMVDNGLEQLWNLLNTDVSKAGELRMATAEIKALRDSGEYTEAKAAQIEARVGGSRIPNLKIMSESLIVSAEELAKFYKFAPDQKSGLTGTIANYLSPYVLEDIAEVFCRDNTVDILDIEYGYVFCLSLPTTYEIERKHLCVLLKKICYATAKLRNDKQGFSLKTSNALYVLQDECQDTIGEDDQGVDKFRSIGLCCIFLTQSRMALYERLGGKERAQTFFNNVTNQYIGMSGDDECAEQGAKVIGRFMEAEYSYNNQRGLKNPLDMGGYSYSEKERYVLRPFEIRAMPKFTFVIGMRTQNHPDLGPAIGRYLVQPRDATGMQPPEWWPGKLRNEIDWWLWFKCKYWYRDFPEFVKLPITFETKPAS